MWRARLLFKVVVAVLRCEFRCEVDTEERVVDGWKYVDVTRRWLKVEI